MSKHQEVSKFSSAKKGFIACLQLTVVFGIVFGVIFNPFSWEGLGKSFLISGMFSFGMGFGNGLINQYLNKKWSWIEQTNQRVTAGIIATVLYTVPLVLAINYVTFILLNGNDPSKFFSKNFFWIHLFYIILCLGVSTFLQARGFMRNWKAAMTQETTRQEIVAKTETAKFESLKSQIDPHFLFNSFECVDFLNRRESISSRKVHNQTI